MKLDLQTYLRTALPIEVKLAADGNGDISGYGSIFGNVDSYGEIVVAGSFAKSIARHKAEASMPAMLWQHDPSRPIGRWTEMHEDDRGLFVKGVLNLATEAGREAHAHLKGGDISGLSIGYREVRTAPDGSNRKLLELDLLEISAVTFPANRQARVIGVKSVGSQIELERMLRDGGLARAAAAKVAVVAWPVLAGDNGLNPETIHKAAERVARLTARIKGA